MNICEFVSFNLLVFCSPSVCWSVVGCCCCALKKGGWSEANKIMVCSFGLVQECSVSYRIVFDFCDKSAGAQWLNDVRLLEQKEVD